MHLSSFNKVPKSLLCTITGALTSLAFAPYDLYLLAIIAPALLLDFWLHSTPASAFRYGYFFGLGMFGAGISWLHISINLFGGINFTASVLLTFIFIAFLALCPALTGYLSARLSRGHPPERVLLLIVPAVWVAGEWFRSWFLTGFPWLNLGYSQIDSPLNGLAPIAGVYGISLAVMFTAGALACLFRAQPRRRYFIMIFAIFLWAGSWWSARLEWTIPVSGKISVALVQGAIPQELKWNPEMLQPTLDLYNRLTKPYMHYDLLVWPEAAVPAYYHQIEDYLAEILVSTRTAGNNFLTGIPVYDRPSGKYYNSVALLGDDIRFYHKRHLVPFGEYLPLDFLLGGLVNYFNIPMSDFSPGPALAPVISTADFNIGISICYEDTFGEEVIKAMPDAEILVNVSNDAWFGDSAAPHQHLQMARMRALESGRYMLRTTNTGITAIIDEKGKVVSRSEQFMPDTLTGEATLFNGHTLYSRYGNYPIIGLCLLLIAGTALRRIINR